MSYEHEEREAIQEEARLAEEKIECRRIVTGLIADAPAVEANMKKARREFEDGIIDRSKGMPGGGF